MMRHLLFFSIITVETSLAQLPIAWDTITVIENNYVLKMPWANGINYSNISSTDLNFDGKKDLVVFDRLNQFGPGRFRCFINIGSPGQTKYRADSYYDYHFPQQSNWAVLRDYNCDGKEDLFCSTSAGIKVYKNTSTVSNGLNFSLVKPLLYSNYNPAGPPSLSNLYASSIGVPGIEDIDGDGDLDILTFSPQGVLIEYHRNVSATCDSLVFELDEDCWGSISETNCEVDFNVCPHKSGKISPVSTQPTAKTYHAGSCLTCLDSDGDGDKDLIMGDISCNTVQYIHNTGSTLTAHFTDTTKRYPNYPGINSTTQIKMNNFPCAYFVDVDGDNKKDLVATPNAFGSENYKSVWYYKNASTTNTVNFQFVKNNFLQDEMIEVGQNSFPVLIDYDADGKKDLLIGTYGYYNTNSLRAQLTLYKNTGTLAQPVFSLITRDYASLSQYSLSYVIPTVGDIDNDLDIDICVGTSSGQIHWLENTAGAGNPCNFSVLKINPFTFTTTSSTAAPQLFDINQDNLLDLLIGTKNGRISYYKNIGTSSTPAFSLVTDFFGNVDVKGDPNLYGLDGYATPFFYNDVTGIKLLVGSVSGDIFQFSVPSVITNSFSLITNKVNGYNEGGQSTVWYEDINNDNKRDLFIGNASGGLKFCSSNSLFVKVEEFTPEKLNERVILYPNPNNGILHINFEKLYFDQVKIVVYDILGKEVISSGFSSNPAVVDISELKSGVYFAGINMYSGSQRYSITKKIVKE
jgi:hypothetical protein